MTVLAINPRVQILKLVFKASHQETKNFRQDNTYNSALWWQVSSPRSRNSRSSGASGDRRHNRNVITFAHRSCFLLQVTDVFIVDIQVDESAQLAFVRVKMPPHIGMLRHQCIHGFSDRGRGNLHRGLFPNILAQRRRNVNLAHRSNLKEPARFVEVSSSPAWSGRAPWGTGTRARPSPSFAR